MLRHYLGPHTAQARSLSSNKEYVVHPTHIHPNVDICPLCVRHLWKKEKIPMVQINSIENGRFSAGTH